MGFMRADIPGVQNPWPEAMSQDPWTWLVGSVDTAFMMFYAHLRRNARLIARLTLTDSLTPRVVTRAGDPVFQSGESA